ncbi:MAG: hypothetical protein WCT13_05505 [Patescibacteria group bacterium]|jgi:hypothetical protein
MLEPETDLNEGSMNLVSKILLAAIAAWLIGKATKIKLRGTQAEIGAITNAMMASRRFQEELRLPGATIDTVMRKLHLKNATASEFEKILGIRFPL